ncbi:MAG: cytochrome b5 domain-containing protein [Candidatus Paceibacterota bacterium]
MKIITIGVGVLLIFLGIYFISGNDKEEAVIIDDQMMEDDVGETREMDTDSISVDIDDEQDVEIKDTEEDEEVETVVEKEVEVSAPTPVPTLKPEPIVTKPAPEPAPELEPQVSGYTLSEVAKHNTSSSCWTVVDGNVYDVTSFINQHPGGEREIMEICGIDGTKKFQRQHGGDREPENTLESFYIGKQI